MRYQRRGRAEVLGFGEMPAATSRHHAEKCAGKVDYPSKVTAKHAARKATAAYGKRFRAYRCKVCGRWHLTTSGFNTVGR